MVVDFQSPWIDLIASFVSSLSPHSKIGERLVFAALEGLDRPTPLHHNASERVSQLIEELSFPGSGGATEVLHPLSGGRRPASLHLPFEETLTKAIAELAAAHGDPRLRFLAIWRQLPLLAAQRDPVFAVYPADPQFPDRSIWHAADARAALRAAVQGSGGPALLSLSIGPVQPFIEAARSVRDLWSGSALLSWLSFSALSPLLQALGPQALVFPALRGSPLVDLWLREQGLEGLGLPTLKARTAPSLPHRFLALVPWGAEGAIARRLADDCVAAAQDAWRAVAEEVHATLREGIAEEAWDADWQDQAVKMFEVHASLLPLDDADEATVGALLGRPPGTAVPETIQDLRALALLAAPDAPGGPASNVGRWQDWVALAGRILEAKRGARLVPPNPGAGDGPSPAKCTIMGSFEQMGPAELAASRGFWENVSERVSVKGVRLRRGERLCAPALVKRFSGPVALARRLQVEPTDLRFPDVATVAAASWLADHAIDPDAVRKAEGAWSGRWLHWQSPLPATGDDEAACPEELFRRLATARKERPVPTYYAILMLDGDRMGAWLRGELTPKMRSLLGDETVRRLVEAHGGKEPAGLDSRRPIGPEIHAAISQALGHFASQTAPRVVEEHQGTLVYSGGDDVLALLPVERALSCASALEASFRRWCPLEGPSMGSAATVSVGLAVVPIREDLRLALETARSCERRAKAAGRNRLAITLLRRSGGGERALFSWPAVPLLQRLSDAFRDPRASDRWSYRLRELLPTLASPRVPEGARRAELLRQAKRSESPWEALLPCSESDPHPLVGLYRAFVTAMTPLDQPPETVFSSFVEAAQIASFLARGRDA